MATKKKKKPVVKKKKVRAKPKSKKRSRLPKLIRKLEKALADVEAKKKKKVTRAEITKANEAWLLRAKKLAKKRGRSEEFIEDLESVFRESYVEELDLVESEIPYIMQELILAEDEGNFDARAYELAEEFDWDPHEVYSLWYGYEPD